MSKGNVEVSSGIGVLGILGIIFVTLKILGLGTVATWSWWLVLLPFYVGLLIFLAILIGVFIFALIGAALK